MNETPCRECGHYLAMHGYKLDQKTLVCFECERLNKRCLRADAQNLQDRLTSGGPRSRFREWKKER